MNDRIVADFLKENNLDHISETDVARLTGRQLRHILKEYGKDIYCIGWRDGNEAAKTVEQLESVC